MKNGEQEIIIRTATAVSDPAVLTLSECEPSRNDSSTLKFSDREKRCSAELNIDVEQELLHLNLTAHAPEPIWMIEWKIHGLICDEIIVPALGGQLITSEMPEETELSYKYPFWLNAQFIIGMNSGNGFLLHSR
ncbi:MAG: hypothetical protein EHM72_16265, partial [Calditrichaeota bacterium]